MFEMVAINTGVLGLAQVALVIQYHENLKTVVHMQIIAMSILLIIQLIYFFNKKTTV